MTCGKIYKIQVSQRGDKYCSVYCYRKTFPKRVNIKCKQCGKQFSERKKRILENRGKYCSPVCYWDSMKISKEEFNNRRKIYIKKYRKENHDWYIHIKQKGRALKSGFGGSFTKEEWRIVKEKNNNSCARCKKVEPDIKLTVDHIVPLSVWKEWSQENRPSYRFNDIDNIQPLCGPCNSAKWKKIERFI